MGEAQSDMISKEMAKMAVFKQTDTDAAPHLDVFEAGVQNSSTSVIDFENSLLTRFPTQSDSVKSDVKYYSFLSTGENAESHNEEISASMEQHIKGSVGEVGVEASNKASMAAANEHASQRKTQRLDQTAVYTAFATHKIFSQI